MSDQQINEVRAMMSLFLRSGWRDLHVRTHAVELFLAREDGVPSPMARAASDGKSVNAPHLATLISLAETGTVVSAGDRIAVLELLGQHEDVVADQAGTVAAHVATPGALVEYGQPLLTLTP
jgi:biotin carboxyl carrier protein